MDNIIIATVKEWNIENYFQLKRSYENKYNFHLVTSKDELTFQHVLSISPKYIFFPHWSWKIDEKIHKNFECIVFHETNLPFGRGGSPIQNLIARGIYDTKISALKADDGIDSGDIYLKEDFNISIGSAEENFIKISNVIFNKLIPKIIDEDLIPKKQETKATNFKRRKPEESDIQTLETKSIVKLYDFIRMLDADGYPKAFINLDFLKINFSEVHLKNKKLVGRFEVIENE